MDGLAREIKREKNYVFVQPEAYDLLYTAQSSSQIDSQTRHNYVSHDVYASRIKVDKEKEARRRKAIWVEQ